MSNGLTRIENAKDAAQALVDELRDEDRVALAVSPPPVSRFTSGILGAREPVASRRIRTHSYAFIGIHRHLCAVLLSGFESQDGRYRFGFWGGLVTRPLAVWGRWCQRIRRTSETRFLVPVS